MAGSENIAPDTGSREFFFAGGLKWQARLNISNLSMIGKRYADFLAESELSFVMIQQAMQFYLDKSVGYK